MASAKAIEFEKKLLSSVAQLKELVHRNFSEDTEDKIEFLKAINNTFDIAHSESRRLRKALAYLHNTKDDLEKQLRENNLVPRITQIPPRGD